MTLSFQKSLYDPINSTLHIYSKYFHWVSRRYSSFILLMSVSYVKQHHFVYRASPLSLRAAPCGSLSYLPLLPHSSSPIAPGQSISKHK